MSVRGVSVREGNRLRAIVAAVSVGVVIAVLGVWAQTPARVGVGYDDGVYALLSQALATGEGYRVTSVPQGVPGVKYPPIYPLSQVPFWWVAGDRSATLRGIKVANGVYIGIAAGLFTFLLVEAGILSLGLAVLVALIGFGSGSMMLVTTYPISEPIFLVLAFAVLWLADRTRSDASGLRWLGVGVVAGLAFLTRTVGIALVAAAIIGAWRRAGTRRSGRVAAGAVLISLPWLVFVFLEARDVPELLVPQYGSYLSLYLANLAGSPGVALEIFATNLGAMLQTLGGKLVPQVGPIAESLLGAGLLGLAALGGRRLVPRAPATALFPWLYLLAVAFWAFPPFRFIFALFPLLLALAVVGGTALWRSARSLGGRAGRLAPAAVALLGLLLTVNMGYREARALGRRVWEPAQLGVSRVTGEIIRWVERNTARDAVIAFEFDPLLALYTGRRTVPNSYNPIHAWYRPRSAPVEGTVRMYRDLGVDYVAVRRDVPAAVEPIDRLMGRYPGALRLVFVTPAGGMVFETDHEALREGSGARTRSTSP